MFAKIRSRYKIAALKRRGLQLGNGCRIIDLPNFGTEPYLISIGNHVEITSNVSFITHDGGTWVFRERPEFQGVIKYGRIVIHDNCFIGYGATILPGVSIGPNSIIAAGAVVAKDIPPGEIWGGVPAKRIGSLEEYAQQCLATTPKYDRARYSLDKKEELLRLFPYPW